MAAVKKLVAASGNAVIDGLAGSSAAMLIARLPQRDCPYLIVVNDLDEAGYMYHDLCQIGGEDAVSFFPSGYKRSIKYGQIDSANEILRTETLSSIQALIQQQPAPTNASGEQPRASLLVVTYPEALAEKVAQSEEVKEAIITLHEDEKVNPKFVADVLLDRGFQRVDYVYEPDNADKMHQHRPGTDHTYN